MAASLQASSIAHQHEVQAGKRTQTGTPLVSPARAVREFPAAPELPALPSMIPEAVIDYYAWLFRQGGFLNLDMTFEQFLAVATTVNPELSISATGRRNARSQRAA